MEQKYDRKKEQYEDALYSLFMDRVAEAEGKKLIECNEKLKADPSAAVPDTFREKCMQIIRKNFAATNRKHTYKTLSKVLQRVAIVVALLLLLMTSALALSPYLRARTLNWVIDVLDDHTNISFSSSDKNAVTVELGWLPANYTCTSVSDDNTVWQFEDGTGHWIILTTTISDGCEISLDTENASLVEETTIKGNPGLYIEKEGCGTLCWNDLDRERVFMLFADNLDEAAMRKVAENIFID